jgi:hypothetical protein
MARSEREYLLEFWDRSICPYCGKSIPEGKRIGSGRKSEGGFCSLDHFTAYHELKFREKAKKLQKFSREQ